MITVLQNAVIGEEESQVEINVYEDGKLIKGLQFVDGEYEDNTVLRNFSGVFSIADYMKFAYEAGKAGKEMTFEKKESFEL